jgi:hypothetical protein
MCWEQSHRKRTIAASRSDDNRDESQEKRDNSKLPTNHRDQQKETGQ